MLKKNLVNSFVAGASTLRNTLHSYGMYQSTYMAIVMKIHSHYRSAAVTVYSSGDMAGIYSAL